MYGRHVPHFEKMLYDNPQLAAAYLAAFQLTGEQQYATVGTDCTAASWRHVDDAVRGSTHEAVGRFHADNCS